MTKEEKDLLLKDLCARLLYGVRMKGVNEDFELSTSASPKRLSYVLNSADFKPYLRPMSSMTRKEEAYWYYHRHLVGDGIFAIGYDNPTYCIFECFEWLNSHHFDYGGLIEKCLALEAPKDMYSI